METFSSRLKLLLKDKGMTQLELSAATSITQGAISKYINGKQEPKSRELYALSKVLDVPMEVWFEDTSDAKNRPNNSKWKARADELEKKLSIVNEALALILQGTDKLREAMK